MGTALLRALVFTISAAFILFLWTLLTFDVPRLPLTPEWHQRAAAQGLLLAAVVAAGFAGATVGFKLLPGGTTLRKKGAIALGFIFAVLVFIVLPLAPTAGLPAIAGIALLVAAGVVAVGGRVFSVRARQEAERNAR